MNTPAPANPVPLPVIRRGRHNWNIFYPGDPGLYRVRHTLISNSAGPLSAEELEAGALCEKFETKPHTIQSLIQELKQALPPEQKHI